MLTNVRKRQIWLDRGNDRCVQYHELHNQRMESLLEKHIYSRGIGRSINMTSNYPHKTHYVGRLKSWDIVVWARLSSGWPCYLFLGTSYPNIHQYGMLMIGWPCLEHSSGLVGRIMFFYPFTFLLLQFGLLISKKISIGYPYILWHELCFDVSIDLPFMNSAFIHLHVAWMNEYWLSNGIRFFFTQR